MKNKSTLHRFINKIDKSGPSGCWLWNSSKSTVGYGVFCIYEGATRDNPIKRPAHRYAWEILVGEIPEGMFVCHKCDIRLCVNPDHLFLGSAQDNTQDMIKKRRGLQCQPKLTYEQAEQIRELYKTGRYSYLQLATLYGVSTQPIVNIMKYRYHKPTT